MLRAGVIEPAQSEWASPVVLVPKPDGTLRFCVDYRRLNAITVRDTYPLPRMDECIDSLGEANVFTTLDCNSGYWQIPVAAKDQDKTTFTCHEATYRYKRMPFGLTNAPATFQRTLDITLSAFKWKSCLVYLDDVIVFSRDLKSHFTHVEAILETLSETGITLKLAKCRFFTDTVKYLGHVIRPGTLEVDEVATAALTKAKPPKTQTELRSFLGLCNVYRRFVPNYSHVAAPLNAFLKKGQPARLPQDLGEEATNAFDELVKRIIAPPVLALPREGLPYEFDTDASDYQVGAALFQVHPYGERKPIGFWSRSLLPAEKNYSTTEKECLTVVWALRTLRPYLQGEKFTVHSDQASWRWLLTIAEPSGRLMRWRLRLSEFDFQILYKKGKLNTQADALSRLTTLGETSSDLDEDIPCFSIDRDYDERYEVGFIEEEFAYDDALLTTETDMPDPDLLAAVTLEELVLAQASDAFCKVIRSRLNGGRTCLSPSMIAVFSHDMWRHSHK